MNFHETVMGKTFFQDQLPKLILALSQIAQALNAPRPAFLVQQDVPPDFLAELYQGNFDPSDVPETPEIASCNQKILQFQEELRKELPGRAWEQVENYQSLLNERSVRQAEQAFAAGFRCATAILAAGLSAPAAAESAAAGKGQRDDKTYRFSGGA